MPYPTESPYNLLDATPSDGAQVIQRKWGLAVARRRNQAQQVNRAFDELRNPRQRLICDALLITDIAAPVAVDELFAQIVQAPLLPEQPGTPRFSLALTDLGCDWQSLCRPVQAREMPITESRRFETLPADALSVEYDR
jgi:hypothetical protein